VLVGSVRGGVHPTLAGRLERPCYGGHLVGSARQAMPTVIPVGFAQQVIATHWSHWLGMHRDAEHAVPTHGIGDGMD
jgi:hypothetical protein